MFILNKKTKVINECNHNDVIKLCQKDTEHYAVAESIDSLKEILKDVDAGKPQQAPPAFQKPENGIESGEGGESTNEGKKRDPEADNEEQEPEDPHDTAGDITLEGLNSMSVEKLRKKAAECGIKGYSNMNKSTLVAMIMDAMEK